MTNPTIHLSLAILLVLVGLLLLCFWLATAAVRRMASAMQAQPESMLPLIGCESPQSSLVHDWDPRFKIVGLIVFIFLVVSLQRLPFVAAALGVAVSVVAVARLPWGRSLRRIMAMNGFLAMFLIVMPLTALVRPDDTLIVFAGIDNWPFNLRGLDLALVIIGKAWTVALLMEPLLATAPLAATLAGLSRLGIPARVGELLLITHRYIHVFADELQRMRNGMNARAFRPGHRLDTLKDYGNFVGMLLVRSFERTHRVYEAMQARGYSGTMPGHDLSRAYLSDWLKMLLLIAIGLGLLLVERMPGGGA